MASSSTLARRQQQQVDDHDQRLSDNDDGDVIDDDGFVLVSSARYPDGSVVVPMVSLSLGRDMAKRRVFVVTKFQNTVHGE
jgi:hypothetical protein